MSKLQVSDLVRYISAAGQLTTEGMKLFREIIGYATDDQIMRFKGPWSQGIYPAGSTVLDGAWTMIALRETGDRPAPQPSGTPAYSLPDSPTWNTQTDPGQVLTGNRYVMSKGGWIRSIRVYLPALSRNYRIIVRHVVSDIEKTIEIDYRLEASEVVVGWYVLASNMIWVTGDTYEILLVSENPSDPSLGFQGEWQYAGTSQSGDPYYGAFNQNNQGTTIRFHEETANNGGNAAAYLAELGAGDVVTVIAGGTTWTYNITSGPSQTGQIYSYSCTRSGAGTIASGAIASVSWGDPNALPPTEYSRIDDFWNTIPDWASTAEGIFSADSSNLVLDNHAYGVDASMQEATVSPDWDVVSYSNL